MGSYSILENLDAMGEKQLWERSDSGGVRGEMGEEDRGEPGVGLVGRGWAIDEDGQGQGRARVSWQV